MNGSRDCPNSGAIERLSLEETPVNSSTNGTLQLEASFQHYHFDTVIGHIEELLMDQEFKNTLDKFMEKYWTEFERSDENKLSYMGIFKEYTEVIEQHIQMHLSKMIPDFAMDAFIQELQEQKNYLDGEVFDILFTLSDFEAFKEMLLDYKDVKEGLVEDLSKCITVTSVAI